MQVPTRQPYPELNTAAAEVNAPPMDASKPLAGGVRKLSATDLNFYYGSFQALKNISMEIFANQVTAFIGPSGCGKSTFLRTLNRMNETVRNSRVEGKIMLDDVTSWSKRWLMCAAASAWCSNAPTRFPNPSLTTSPTVRASTAPSRPRRSTRKGRAEPAPGCAVDEVKDKLNQSAYGLSGGQQQRLCIARALAVDPEVLLLDEPCSALDPIATAKIEDLIFQLKGSCTIVIVTHNMQQAARVADNTGFFLLGNLIEFDNTAVIFKNPAKKETEDYVTAASAEVREPTTLRHFIEELEQLKTKLLEMSATVESSIQRSISAVTQKIAAPPKRFFARKRASTRSRSRSTSSRSTCWP